MNSTWLSPKKLVYPSRMRVPCRPQISRTEISITLILSYEGKRSFDGPTAAANQPLSCKQPTPMLCRCAFQIGAFQYQAKVSFYRHLSVLVLTSAFLLSASRVHITCSRQFSVSSQQSAAKVTCVLQTRHQDIKTNHCTSSLTVQTRGRDCQQAQ